MMFTRPHNLENLYHLTSCQAPLDPPPGLQHEAETLARLKDHAEVANFKGMEVGGFRTCNMHRDVFFDV